MQGDDDGEAIEEEHPGVVESAFTTLERWPPDVVPSSEIRRRTSLVTKN